MSLFWYSNNNNDNNNNDNDNDNDNNIIINNEAGCDQVAPHW